MNITSKAQKGIPLMKYWTKYFSLRYAWNCITNLIIESSKQRSFISLENFSETSQASFLWVATSFSKKLDFPFPLNFLSSLSPFLSCIKRLTKFKVWSAPNWTCKATISLAVFNHFPLPCIWDGIWLLCYKQKGYQSRYALLSSKHQLCTCATS